MISLKEKLIKELHEAQNNGSKKNKIDAYLNLALFQYNKRNFENSKSNLNKIFKLDNQPKYVNYYLALIALNEEENDNAKKYLKAELKINPKNNNAIILLDKLQIHSNIPIITITIALLAIIMYIFTFPSPNYIELLKYGLSNFNLTFFTIITSIFIHANIIHLLLNLIVLIIFGLYLEKYIGSLKFLLIFLISAIVGNVFEVYLIGSTSFVIGLSAGLFGILGSIVLREPLLDVKLFGFVKMPIVLFFGILFILNWFASYFIPNEKIIFGEMSHIFGFLTGIMITGIIYRETIRTFYNWLVMAFGFTVITYGLTRTINAFTNFNANEILIASTMYLLGGFLIFYGFIKLKFENRIHKEVEK
jgi:membrane associated rhomboid family serine protease